MYRLLPTLLFAAAILGACGPQRTIPPDAPGAPSPIAPLLSKSQTPNAVVSPVPATITVFPIPPYGQPRGITVGRDGAIWFSLTSSLNVGRIVPPSSANPSPRPTLYPVDGFGGGMASGPDGSIWFSEEVFSGSGASSFRVGQIVVGTEASPNPSFTSYPAPLFASNLAVGKANSAVWFPDGTRDGSNTIASMSVKTKMFKTLQTPTAASEPWEVTAGPDKAMWFTECNVGRIGRISRDGTIKEYALQKSGRPRGITLGPDGALWFVAERHIGRINRNGVITYFQIPANRGLRGTEYITTGPDGALWFTSYRGKTSSLGRMTTNGTFGRVSGLKGCPTGIVTGPDSALWVSLQPCGEKNSSSIVRVQVPIPAAARR